MSETPFMDAPDPQLEFTESLDGAVCYLYHAAKKDFFKNWMLFVDGSLPGQHLWMPPPPFEINTYDI